MSSGAQKMKTGPDARGIVENESGSAKHENGTRRPRKRRKQVREHKTRKWNPTPSIQPKTCPGAQNMKTGPDTLATAVNEYMYAKHENGTPHPQNCRK
jgi:hypothetical protein